MSDFKYLSVDQLILLQAQDDNIQVVDIRDSNSFATGNISGSLNLTSDNLADLVNDLDKKQALIVLCYHGISSRGFAKYLCEQGFADVYSLEGGFQAWSKIK